MLDISFGGSFFALVKAEQLKLTLNITNAEAIKKIGMEILHKANEFFKVEHPLLKHVNRIDLVEFYSENNDGSSDATSAVIFGNYQLDRSPCGTGVSAKVAAMVAKGELSLNSEYVVKSVIGTKFKAVACKSVNVGEYSAVIPKITGRAFIIGLQSLVMSHNDPFAHGFKV